MYACLVVGLLLLAAPVGALIPDKIEILDPSPDEWVTAGSGETVITAQVLNNTPDSNTPVGGVTVEFTLDGGLGSISPAQAITNEAGYAAAVFTPGNASGDVTIKATVALDASLKDSVDLHIDHAAPYKIADLWYEPEVTAGGETNIVVRIEDRYGNVVDNRNVAESVRFMVGSPAGFVSDTTCPDEISVLVDAAGNATVTLQADTVAGENLVVIQPPAPIRSDYISIFGVAGLPFRITTIVDPDGASVRANSEDRVSFTYTLLDKHGNPAGGQGLWVNASTNRVDRPDETYSRLLISNSRGEVMITYGPEDSVGVATLTATALGNESVTDTTVVEFTSTDPTNMLLSASPQSMPSRDIRTNFVAEVRAKVMDLKGNPVEGQVVTFDIKSVDIDGFEQIDAPYLGKTSATTNTDGYAIVEFHPGAFVGLDKEGWSATAKGTAIARATWGDVSRDITLTWMNYPYLSVETEVSPDTVAVNETVDVKIRLKGDGYKLEPDPIDVVLVMDRSGSMKYDIDRNQGSSNERMKTAQDAADTFVGQMNSTRDRVGLISFASETTKNMDLTNQFSAVKTKISALSATGATQLRRGIYDAILTQNQAEHQPNTIKAVVVMTDGDWNYDGSPIGHGTGYPANSSWAYEFRGNILEPDNYRYYDGLGGMLQEGEKWYDPNRGQDYLRKYDYCTNGEFTNQNMSLFASENGVKLYTITFAYKPGKTVNETMEILANTTGGFYEHAGSGDKLTDIYKRIAGELKTEAGVNTTMNLAFENVNVTGVDVPGEDVFDYVYDDGNSTHIYNRTGTVDHFDGTINQIDDWNKNQKLNFSIGTVRLGQTWEATFRLKVKMEGNINVFGPGSTISFNNGEEELELPATYITAVKSLNNTGMDFAVLNISNLHFTGEEPVDEFLPIAWDLNYTGLYDVTEDVFYSNDNNFTWVKFDRISATNATTGGESTLDVRDLPAGDYTIRVRGYAPDTEDDSATLVQNITHGANGSAYIRLQ